MSDGIVLWCEFLGILDYELSENAVKFGPDSRSSILCLIDISGKASIMEITTFLTSFEKGSDLDDFANYINSDLGLTRAAIFTQDSFSELLLVSNIFVPKNPVSVLEATMLVGSTLDYQEEFAKKFQEFGPQIIINEATNSGLSPFSFQEFGSKEFPDWVRHIHEKITSKISNVDEYESLDSGAKFGFIYSDEHGSIKVFSDFFVTNHPKYGPSLDLMFVPQKLEGSAAGLPRYMNPLSIPFFGFIGAWSYGQIAGLVHRTSIPLSIVSAAGEILKEKRAPFEPEWLVDMLLDSMIHQLETFSVAMHSPQDWINNQKLLDG